MTEWHKGDEGVAANSASILLRPRRPRPTVTACALLLKRSGLGPEVPAAGSTAVSGGNTQKDICFSFFLTESFFLAPNT
jgi:hypothetical protein